MLAASLVLAALLAAAPESPVGGGNGVVAVVLSPDASQVIKESLYRLKGEALSVGFEVRFIQTESATAPLDQVDMVTRGLGAAAVVAFTTPASAQESTSRQLDVWFLDRSTGKTSVTQLKTDEAEADRADVILAVRAVDFIRARMFDSLAQRPATPPPQSPPSAPQRLYLAAGATALHAFDGFSASVSPTLRAGYAVAPWVRAEGEASGLGTQARYQGTAGRIELSHRLVGVGLTLYPYRRARAQPLASVAVSHYRSTAKALPVDGFQGQDFTFQTVAVKTAVGVAVPLGRRWELAAKGGCLWLSKIPRYFVVDERVASLTRPTYTVDLTFGVAFR